MEVTEWLPPHESSPVYITGIILSIVAVLHSFNKLKMLCLIAKIIYQYLERSYRDNMYWRLCWQSEANASDCQQSLQ